MALAIFVYFPAHKITSELRAEENHQELALAVLRCLLASSPPCLFASLAGSRLVAAGGVPRSGESELVGVTSQALVAAGAFNVDEVCPRSSSPVSGVSPWPPGPSACSRSSSPSSQRKAAPEAP